MDKSPSYLITVNKNFLVFKHCFYMKILFGLGDMGVHVYKYEFTHI